MKKKIPINSSMNQAHKLGESRTVSKSSVSIVSNDRLVVSVSDKLGEHQDTFRLLIDIEKEKGRKGEKKGGDKM